MFLKVSDAFPGWIRILYIFCKSTGNLILIVPYKIKILKLIAYRYLGIVQ